MADQGVGAPVQRVTGLLVLLAAGIISLPLAAALLDDGDSENWIIPAQLVGMALVGAVAGVVLPGLTRADSSAGRRALLGAILAVMMALLGVLLFFLILNGFGGA